MGGHVKTGGIFGVSPFNSVLGILGTGSGYVRVEAGGLETI
jgi:hypothetical protein